MKKIENLISLDVDTEENIKKMSPGQQNIAQKLPIFGKVEKENIAIPETSPPKPRKVRVKIVKRLSNKSYSPASDENYKIKLQEEGKIQTARFSSPVGGSLITRN